MVIEEVVGVEVGESEGVVGGLVVMVVDGEVVYVLMVGVVEVPPHFLSLLLSLPSSPPVARPLLSS